MQIFNSNALNNNERFIKAVLVGIACAVGLGLLYGIVISAFPVEMAVFYVFIGFCIGKAIQKFGRGVGQKFAVLGALCTLLAIVIGDSCVMFGPSGGLFMILNPKNWLWLLTNWISAYASNGIFNLIGLAFRLFGIYYAYQNSSIF